MTAMTNKTGVVFGKKTDTLLFVLCITLAATMACEIAVFLLGKVGL